MIVEKTIQYKKEKKDEFAYYCAFFRFKFSPLLVIFPVAILLSLYFIVVSILEKTKEPVILASSASALSIFLFIVFLTITIRYKKATKVTYHGLDSASLELMIDTERCCITNSLSNIKIVFNLKEIKRIKYYKRVIVIEVENKGIITFPNIPEIKTLLTNIKRPD